MGEHLLNLRTLASATISDYALLGFEGREEISQPFEYRLELIHLASSEPPKLSEWIGQLAEFDVSPDMGHVRVFAGRIYAARRVADGDLGRIFVSIRPAYHALSYTKATQFIQDKSSKEIFEAMCADVTGLVKTVSLSPNPPKRGYAVRYDESEIDFLARLLAQDGIMYFFTYDRNSGPYRHKMIVTNKPADYIDIEGSPLECESDIPIGHVDVLESSFAALPGKSKHVSFNVNKLDTPFLEASTSSLQWGAVYTHEYETIGFEALAAADVASRQKATDGHSEQAAKFVEGNSTEHSVMAGGRAELKGADDLVPRRVVFTRVVHSARDPWMLGGGQHATYSNQFSAIDASQSYRPPVNVPQRVAPGPLLGVIGLEGTSTGEIKVDTEWRVPVLISNARNDPKFKPSVWLPVQQQWSHSTHGAQFFPRIGTRVIVDFLYGNPDLPIITGCMYTPSQAYPFDPASKVTQSGWRSVTEKNGSITQEFYFEDKSGSEEIKLYTGRDYRRVIDQDDWGTVKRDQTLEVQRNRTRKVTGEEKVDVEKTRTITVQQKNLLESKAEIQLKVGSSTITLKPDGIEIKALKITIKAETKVEMQGGAQFSISGPIGEVKADGMLTVKGGIVMIN
ncbi:type VI secretion system tip protein TssI/VgrG [Novosphingobium sp.]|uniref:type VI secretion system Vgr family protein n=1 Tax=Novosphingobium sp. TaxID=1874826 RepID=UPI001D3BACED|nr:type VI secretion system tip protein TssI/VgrG [Novosphingobium sp.]MBX9662985.1 type VI secretion system tip protein VgrG [Novosphingobium sp.]